MKIVCSDWSDVAIFQDFNSEIGYKWQKLKYAREILTNVQSVILTAQLFLTACQKLLTLMGFAIVTLGSSEITDWKNQFELV